MNRSQAVVLANAIQNLQPGWQQPGIVAQLLQLAQTWTGTEAALYAHAIATAGNPLAKTPGALNAIPPTTVRPFKPLRGRGNVCYICSRDRAGCDALRAWEIDNNVADPHEFESPEQAEASRARPQHPERGNILKNLRTGA